MSGKRLTKEQWLEARQTWEADTTLTFEALAERLGISRPAVSKMAGRQGWVKASSLKSINRAAQIRADMDNVTEKVTSVTGKKPLAESIDQSTELRSKIIQAHRAEWRLHADLYGISDLKDRDFEVSKKAKISAEMITLRQKGERIAWGMDTEQSEASSTVSVNQLEAIRQYHENQTAAWQALVQERNSATG